MDRKAIFLFVVACISTISSVDLKNRKLEGVIKYHKAIPYPLPKGSCLIVKLSVYKNDKAESKMVTKHVIYNPERNAPAKYSMEFPDTDISEDDLYNLVVSAILNVGWCSDDKNTIGSKVVKDADFHTITLIGVLPDKIIPTSDIVIEGPEIALEPVSFTNPKALKNAHLKVLSLFKSTKSPLIIHDFVINTTRRTTTRKIKINTTKTPNTTTRATTTTTTKPIVGATTTTPFKPTGSITLPMLTTRLKITCPKPCADECYFAGCAAACCYAMALSLQPGQQQQQQQQQSPSCTGTSCASPSSYQMQCTGHNCQQNENQPNQMAGIVTLESSSYPCTGSDCSQMNNKGQPCSGLSCSTQTQCTGQNCPQQSSFQPLPQSYPSWRTCQPSCYSNCAPYCLRQCCSSSYQGYGRK